MEEIAATHFAKIQVFGQFLLTFFLLIPLVLIARTVVAGTRYSPILLIVVFGLAMGYIMVATRVSTPGLPEFQIVNLISTTTIIALIASFFVGGQELRRVFGKTKVENNELETPSQDEVCVGTTKSQFVHIARTFFLLLGLETAYKAIVGTEPSTLTQYYPLLAYVALILSTILIDSKAIVVHKKSYYVKKAFIEIAAIVLILIATYHIANWIEDFIALPQIFFAMVITASLGAVFYKRNNGPTVKSLLIAGLPLVLAANFMIGGSRIADAFNIEGMNSVLLFGFFGQIVWMFGGIALLMLFAKTSNVRNLAPGLAGGLSHAGLTGACTAGDLGKTAASRTPIMINLPFAAHIFVFSILAISAKNEALTMIPALIVLLIGVALTLWSFRILKAANGEDNKEVQGLMKFALGWQLTAMFGSFVILSIFGMQLNHVAVAATSSLSHFGLFAATQGGMFGEEVAALLPFIFAMPFLVHPFVFFLFGKAMERDGEMPNLPVFILAVIGIIGVMFAVLLI